MENNDMLQENAQAELYWGTANTKGIRTNTMPANVAPIQVGVPKNKASPD